MRAAAPASASAPGPRGLPLVGNTLQFTRDQLGFCMRALHDYGDVVKFRIAGDDWYMLSNPADIYSVCVTDAHKFHKPEVNKKIFEKFTGNGLVASDGDFWKRQSKLVRPGFHRQRIEAYGEIMVQYTQAMVDSWRADTQVNFSDEMVDLTLKIFAKTLFDAEIEGAARRCGAAMHDINEVLVDHITLPLPVPRWWPSKKNRRKVKALDEVDAIVRGVIEERRREGKDHGDLLSMLLLSETESGERMNDTELRDEAMTLFFAGHETTAHAMAWLWYLLGNHPDDVAVLQAELADNVGDRPLTVADLEALPYLEQCVKEGMRVLPSVWVFMRQAIEDVQYGGYPIPTGSTIFISPYVVHHDARIYPQPYDFRPHRFEKEAERKLPRGAYFPFSMGPRVCLGKAFAMMEARLVIGTILQRALPRNPRGFEPTLYPRLSLSAKDGLPYEVALR